MPIGCNTLYDGGELGQTSDFDVPAIRRSLETNAALGYETVEYSHLCHLSRGDAAAIGAHTRDLGMTPWSVHSEGATGFVLGTTPDEAGRALVNAVETCAAVGARVVVVHVPILHGLGLGDLPDIRALLAEDLAGLRPGVERAGELGIELALENGGALAHWVYVNSLVERINREHVGLCVDTGHANLGDLGAPRAIRMAGPRLRTLHLHDNYGKVDDHLPPGRATIDWPAVFAALAEVGYTRTLQLELTDRAPHRDYDQTRELREGIENTRRLSIPA